MKNLAELDQVENCKNLKWFWWSI